MGKKKDVKKLEKRSKELESLRIEYNSLDEQIRRAREELGYVEFNKMRIKNDIKRMMDRQKELEQKRSKLSGISADLACCAPY